MKISLDWLKEKNACEEGIRWFSVQKETDALNVIKTLMADNRSDWANWLIVRLMEYKQYVAYAIFAAEQVVWIYEKKYPGDKRPRTAIDAAKKCLKDQSKENKAAADAAYAAAYAAYAAARDAAAYAAAYAAYAAAAYTSAPAAYAAAAAAYAAACDAARDAAAYAAYADADAAYAKKMKIKILRYGIKLLD